MSRRGGGIFLDADFASVVDRKIVEVTTRSKDAWTEEDWKAKKFFMRKWNEDVKHEFGDIEDGHLEYAGSADYPELVLDEYAIFFSLEWPSLVEELLTANLESADFRDAFSHTVRQIVSIVQETITLAGVDVEVRAIQKTCWLQKLTCLMKVDFPVRWPGQE